MVKRVKEGPWSSTGSDFTFAGYFRVIDGIALWHGIWEPSVSLMARALLWEYGPSRGSTILFCLPPL